MQPTSLVPLKMRRSQDQELGMPISRSKQLPTTCYRTTSNNVTRNWQTGATCRAIRKTGDYFVTSRTSNRKLPIWNNRTRSRTLRVWCRDSLTMTCSRSLIAPSRVWDQMQKPSSCSRQTPNNVTLCKENAATKVRSTRGKDTPLWWIKCRRLLTSWSMSAVKSHKFSTRRSRSSRKSVGWADDSSTLASSIITTTEHTFQKVYFLKHSIDWDCPLVRSLTNLSGPTSNKQVGADLDFFQKLSLRKNAANWHPIGMWRESCCKCTLSRACM